MLWYWCCWFWLLLLVWISTHWDRNTMAAIFQTTFWGTFSWMKIYGFRLRFHWSLFLTFELTIPALVQIMDWRRPMVVSLLTHIYIYMSLGFNELIRYARSSLASGWCGYNIKLMLFKLISRIAILSITCEIAFGWLPQDLNIGL